MQISRETEYAVRCIFHLARTRDRVVPIDEIARAIRAPRSLVAKVLQRLAQAGLLHSHRGVGGGFALARDPEKLSLYDIFCVTEGEITTRDLCAVSKQTCGADGYCVLHPFWQKLRRELVRLLRSHSAARPVGFARGSASALRPFELMKFD